MCAKIIIKLIQCIMSFRVRDIQGINRSQLNSSTSKQQYTFSKQKRFSQLKRNQSYKYYDLPSTNQHKAGTFSSSQRKSPFGDKQKISRPSPDKYNPQEINVTQEMISFAPSRQSCKINSFIKVVDGPGPGAYEPHFVMDSSSKYSICGKHPDEKCSTVNVPGPGNYPIKSWLQTSKILSTDKYRGGTVIKNTNKSFRTISLGECLDLPMYNTTLNRKGMDSFNKTGASFGKSLRFRQRVKTEIPGPGTQQVL